MQNLFVSMGKAPIDDSLKSPEDVEALPQDVALHPMPPDYHLVNSTGLTSSSGYQQIDTVADNNTVDVKS